MPCHWRAMVWGALSSFLKAPVGKPQIPSKHLLVQLKRHLRLEIHHLLANGRRLGSLKMWRVSMVPGANSLPSNAWRADDKSPKWIKISAHATLLSTSWPLRLPWRRLDTATFSSHWLLTRRTCTHSPSWKPEISLPTFSSRPNPLLLLSATTSWATIREASIPSLACPHPAHCFPKLPPPMPTWERSKMDPSKNFGTLRITEALWWKTMRGSTSSNDAKTMRNDTPLGSPPTTSQSSTSPSLPSASCWGHLSVSASAWSEGSRRNSTFTSRPATDPQWKPRGWAACHLVPREPLCHLSWKNVAFLPESGGTTPISPVIIVVGVWLNGKSRSNALTTSSASSSMRTGQLHLVLACSFCGGSPPAPHHRDLRLHHGLSTRTVHPTPNHCPKTWAMVTNGDACRVCTGPGFDASPTAPHPIPCIPGPINSHMCWAAWDNFDVMVNTRTLSPAFIASCNSDNSAGTNVGVRGLHLPLSVWCEISWRHFPGTRPPRQLDLRVGNNQSHVPFQTNQPCATFFQQLLFGGASILAKRFSLRSMNSLHCVIWTSAIPEPIPWPSSELASTRHLGTVVTVHLEPGCGLGCLRKTIIRSEPAWQHALWHVAMRLATPLSLWSAKGQQTESGSRPTHLEPPAWKQCPPWNKKWPWTKMATTLVFTSGTSGPRWFSLTLLHWRILRRIWWWTFSHAYPYRGGNCNCFLSHTARWTPIANTLQEFFVHAVFVPGFLTTAFFSKFPLLASKFLFRISCSILLFTIAFNLW